MYKHIIAILTFPPTSGVIDDPLSIIQDHSCNLAIAYVMWVW